MRLRLRLRCAGSRGGAREGESRAPGGGLRLRVRLLCGSIGSPSYREQGLRRRVGIAPTLPSSQGSREISCATTPPWSFLRVPWRLPNVGAQRAYLRERRLTSARPGGVPAPDRILTGRPSNLVADRANARCVPKARWFRRGRSTGHRACCASDGGRPSGLAVQAESPNHRKLRQAEKPSW